MEDGDSGDGCGGVGRGRLVLLLIIYLGFKVHAVGSIDCEKRTVARRSFH